MSKVTSVPQTNCSLYSLPVEALNLIVESKSLPFDFLALMGFHRTFDVTLHDSRAQVFINSQIGDNKTSHFHFYW